MEGHCPDILGIRPKKRCQPLLELIGRLIGKGDGKDAPGHRRGEGAELIRQGGIFLRSLQKTDILFGDAVGDLPAVAGPAKPHKVGDSVDQDCGLAASGAGQEQQRSLCCQNSLLLHIVELFKLVGNIGPPGRYKSIFQFFCHSHTYSIL